MSDDPVHDASSLVTASIIFAAACMIKVWWHATFAPDPTLMVKWIIITITGTVLLTVMTPLPGLTTPKRLPLLAHLQCQTCPYRLLETNPFSKCVCYGGLRVTLFSGGIFNRCLGRN